MTIDNESPPGSWRRELILKASTPSEFREIISELEHCLKQARANCDALTEQNSILMNQLTEAVAREMEARAKSARLQNEITKLWNTLKTV
jgi:peptidoglycan hydrolase CwlO-like protein